jgi:hypothetical protein
VHLTCAERRARLDLPVPAAHNGFVVEGEVKVGADLVQGTRVRFCELDYPLAPRGAPDLIRYASKRKCLPRTGSQWRTGGERVVAMGRLS